MIERKLKEQPLLLNKKALIVGSNSEIRQAVAKQLEEQGSETILIDRPEDVFPTPFNFDILVNLTGTSSETEKLFLLTEYLVNQGASIINLVFSPEELISYQAPSEDGGYLPGQSAEIIARGKALARELGQQGIRVNSLLMGPVAAEDFYKLLPEEMSVSQVSQTRALKKLPEPKDIGQAVVFFASDESSFITGQAFPIGDLRSR